MAETQSEQRTTIQHVFDRAWEATQRGEGTAPEPREGALPGDGEGTGNREYRSRTPALTPVAAESRREFPDCPYCDSHFQVEGDTLCGTRWVCVACDVAFSLTAVEQIVCVDGIEQLAPKSVSTIKTDTE